MRELSTIADMQVFSRIVASGSMSRAARDVGLTPASVSKIVKRMEKRLGARLLHRTTRQITLTEMGRGLHDRVAAILAAVEEAECFVTDGVAQARGSLRISAPTSFGRMHVAPHLGGFLAEHPHLTVDLQLSDSFVDIVKQGFDLAIRIAELDNSSLIARRLAPAHRLLVASPAYLAAKGAPCSIRELGEHALLNHTGEPWRLDGPDGLVQVRTQAPLQTNSSEVVREAVLTGLGIALRSTWDIGTDLKAGRLVVVMPQWRATRRIGVYAVYPSRHHLSFKVRRFIDHFAALYGPAPYWNEGLNLAE